MDENLIEPKYYNLPNGLELQDLLEVMAKDLSGVEAGNFCAIVKYCLRYGKKDTTKMGRAETMRKIATFAIKTAEFLEKEDSKESSKIAPSEWIEDPLHDED